MSSHVPLAARMRPRDLSEVLGQARWLGPGGEIRLALEAGALRSMVLWGPPGCGKTSIARALAAESDLRFVQLSAVLDGVKELRRVLADAETLRRFEDRGTLLFVDEIHRWNKAQQDALLPHVEDGRVVLVGATTENPSFELNPALRSRLRVIHLDPLTDAQVRELLLRALSDPERGLPSPPVLSEDGLEALVRYADGDARRALDALERCAHHAGDAPLTADHLSELLRRADLRHDRSGDAHYDVVSALIKSMRGSDPDAAIYWLARMLEAGEDPLYIARRLVVFASEDVGNADPRGLQVAVAALHAVHHVGLPEGRIPLAQAVTWLATSPKSNASYKAIDAALEEVRRSGALPVPDHLRNHRPPGTSYLYPHDHPHHIVAQAYLPEALTGCRFYEPVPHAEERTISERLRWWRRKLDGDG